MKIDVRGEICPYPMMKTSEALKKLEGDETLEVLTDHAPALGTIPWEAAKNGYETSIEGAAELGVAADATKIRKRAKPQELHCQLAGATRSAKRVGVGTQLVRL